MQSSCPRPPRPPCPHLQREGLHEPRQIGLQHWPLVRHTLHVHVQMDTRVRRLKALVAHRYDSAPHVHLLWCMQVKLALAAAAVAAAAIAAAV